MLDESALRAVLIVVMLVLLPIGMYHRLMSQSTGEKLDRRQEGVFILATLRPLGAVFWLAVFAWMIDPRWMAWSSVSVPLWSRWAGVGLLLIGSALLVWTFRSLGRNLTDTVVTREKHTLVVHGPYRWIRHPLYSSAALLVAAMSLIAANWFFFAAGVVLLCVLIIRTRTEEENLAARFGESYRTYMARTGRFFPRIGATSLIFVLLSANASPASGQIAASQPSVLAGNEAWQRIGKSAPYEWAGDIESEAAWTVRSYGDFLEEYPDHPLAAEAMLNVAIAIWARGGYPELFGYVFAPSWEEHDARKRQLGQWFDTSGFGGGLSPRLKQEPEAALRAREMFVALAKKYPSSKSAVMARYYRAVILDYCLNDEANALIEFRAFLKRHPNLAPFSNKARRRIAALSR